MTKTICLLFLPPLITVASLDSRFTTSCSKYKAPITQQAASIDIWFVVMNDTPWPPDTPKTQFKVRLQPTAQDRGHRPLCRGVRDYRLTTLVLERRLGQVLCNMETCQGGPRLTLHSPGMSVVTSSSDEMNEGSGISLQAPE